MTAQKLTDSQLKAIQQEMEALNLKIESKEVSAEEALKKAYAQRDVLRATYDATDKSELRVETWNVVNDSISVFKNAKFESELGAEAKFKADSPLDISATKRVNDVKKMIRGMTFNGQAELTREEAYFAGKKRNGESYKEGDRVSVEVICRANISMLNNYNKYIDKDHPKLKELWKMYNDRTLANYMDYAKDLTKRSPVRDAGLIEKIKKNKDGYTDQNMVQAILNLLEPTIPQAEEKKDEPKSEGTSGSPRGPRSRKAV